MASVLKIHAQNPKIFEFRGKPLVLLTATEHYGAVLNRPFDFERYLADAAEKRITLTRLFTLFRELQTPINPYSTCKPETPDLVTPFLRTGPGRARDGELKFDLDQPNPEYYDRLNRFLTLASDYGIIVEVVLFSNTYAPEVWSLNPLHAKNNVNDIEEIEWPDYLSQRHRKLNSYQLAHLTRIVEVTNGFDNIIYEICNEPGGDVAGDNLPSCAEVNAWLEMMMATLRQLESALPNQHLIAGQEAFSYTPFTQGSDHTFRQMDYNIVNMHPLPNTVYGGVSYPLGDFMSKQLALRPLRDFCLATYTEGKPLNHDEDNIASQYKDVEAWTIHRKRAWTTLLSGAHYDYIDFSITIYTPEGTPQSNRAIRSWMKVLSELIHSLDLVRARPLPDIVVESPAYTVVSVFGVADEDICIYLADEREVVAARGLANGAEGDPSAGTPITGELVINLPATKFRLTWADPRSGLVSIPIAIQGNEQLRLSLPTFSNDLLARLTCVA